MARNTRQIIKAGTRRVGGTQGNLGIETISFVIAGVPVAYIYGHENVSLFSG